MRNPELIEWVEEHEEVSLSPQSNDDTSLDQSEVFLHGSAPHADGVKRPLSVSGRLALWLAPLYSACYDLQMQIGQGVRLVRQRLQLPSYPRSAPALRAVFMSDLHYGPPSGRLATRQAWKLAHEAKPDILFLGGDFLYLDESGLPALLRELQRWQREPPPAGIYACLGNHDLLASETLITCLEACGVQVLINEAIELPAPWDGIWIVGSDEPTMGDPQPELALAEVPRGACAIMLAHSPDICEFGVLKRCALTLCGDTHGGQICMPNGEPIYLPSKWGRLYPGGLYRHAGNWVFVSRGVGAVAVPFRLWSPPDIAVFELCGQSVSTVSQPRVASYR
ncbi:MAG: metallophosphoesterase [Armatimonadota bacterium]|nr:metallophosphoesterase [Armatimonadota bacterium]